MGKIASEGLMSNISGCSRKKKPVEGSLQVSPDPFDSLPDEIFEAVFSRLPMRDFLTSRLVSRGWNDRVSHLGRLWKPHCLDKSFQNHSSIKEIDWKERCLKENRTRANWAHDGFVVREMRINGKVFEAGKNLAFHCPDGKLELLRPLCGRRSFHLSGKIEEVENRRSVKRVLSSPSLLLVVLSLERGLEGRLYRPGTGETVRSFPLSDKRLVAVEGRRACWIPSEGSLFSLEGDAPIPREVPLPGKPGGIWLTCGGVYLKTQAFPDCFDYHALRPDDSWKKIGEIRPTPSGHKFLREFSGEEGFGFLSLILGDSERVSYSTLRLFRDCGEREEAHQVADGTRDYFRCCFYPGGVAFTLSERRLRVTPSLVYDFPEMVERMESLLRGVFLLVATGDKKIRLIKLRNGGTPTKELSFDQSSQEKLFSLGEDYIAFKDKRGFMMLTVLDYS